MSIPYPVRSMQCKLGGTTLYKVQNNHLPVHLSKSILSKDFTASYSDSPRAKSQGTAKSQNKNCRADSVPGGPHFKKTGANQKLTKKKFFFELEIAKI